MINVKDQISAALLEVSSNVTDAYPTSWEEDVTIQLTEEENNVFEYVDGRESKSYLRYRIDIWSRKSTSNTTLEVDKKVSALGLKRTSCQDMNEENIKHKQMRYEGIIDNDTEMVYHVS